MMRMEPPILHHFLFFDPRPAVAFWIVPEANVNVSLRSLRDGLNDEHGQRRRIETEESPVTIEAAGSFLRRNHIADHL